MTSKVMQVLQSLQVSRQCPSLEWLALPFEPLAPACLNHHGLHPSFMLPPGPLPTFQICFSLTFIRSPNVVWCPMVSPAEAPTCPPGDSHVVRALDTRWQHRALSAGATQGFSARGINLGRRYQLWWIRPHTDALYSPKEEAAHGVKNLSVWNHRLEHTI